jgi:hypothetical protein
MTTITERMTTVFQRAIEVCWDKIQTHKTRVMDEEDVVDINRDSYHIILFDNTIFMYDFCYNDDEDGIKWDEVRVRFILYPLNSTMHMSYIAFSDNNGKQDAKDKIKSLEGKIFTRCECNKEWTVKDGFCEKCYTLAHIHKDDCAICMDRTLGVWIKLPCSHIFHKNCWHKHHETAQKEKCKSACPLCRSRSHAGEYKEI